MLVGLAWLDEVALLREPTPAGQPPRRLRARLLGSTGLAIIGAVSALATLVTPFGIDGWRYIENLARNPAITAQVSEWRAPSPLDPAGAVFYLSLVVVLGVVAFRLRSDRRRPPARFVAPIVTVVVFGVLGVVHRSRPRLVGARRARSRWSRSSPGSSSPTPPRWASHGSAPAPPARRPRARLARSPLNAVVMVVLVVAGVALLPLWRPLGPAGVPIATLSSAPQGIAAELDRRRRRRRPRGTRRQRLGPAGLGLVARVRGARAACYAVDSRIELFPADLWTDVNAREVYRGDQREIGRFDASDQSRRRSSSPPIRTADARTALAAPPSAVW